jgi:hypothetical protein
MKRFKVVYIPHSKKEEEWTFIGAKSVERVLQIFDLGAIISIVEAPFEE